MSPSVKIYDDLFEPDFAAQMIRACERFETYGVVGNGITKAIDHEKAYATGSRATEKYSARSNYFRASYAYDGVVTAEGLEPLFSHARMIDAARDLHGLPVVQPRIAYANFLLPGHDLAVHTDVPEFRGAHRRKDPLWLLVVMHHSSLFEPYRVKIATITSYFQACDGGELVYYPEGAAGAARLQRPRFNAAVMLDADSIFHGVLRVSPNVPPAPDVESQMLLRFGGAGQWEVLDGTAVVARCRFEELRFSITWKAYCFADEADLARWRDGSEDLDMAYVYRTLLGDLRQRGRLNQTPAFSDLPHILTDEYVRFPPPLGVGTPV
jgi:hypothetical protein